MSQYIYNFFLILTFLFSAFFFWRKSREEHFELDQLFDGFILSFLVGMVAARFAYVLVNFNQYGWAILSWLNLFSDTGMFMPFGIAVAGLFLYRFAKKQHWEAFEVLDLWTPAVVSGVGIYHLGLAVSGSSPYLMLGPVGIPTALLVTFFSIFLTKYLIRVELRYRTFRWYRSGRDVALPGFVVLLGLMLISIFMSLIMLINITLTNSEIPIAEAVLYLITYFCGFLIGATLMLMRSGKIYGRVVKKKVKTKSR